MAPLPTWQGVSDIRQIPRNGSDLLFTKKRRLQLVEIASWAVEAFRKDEDMRPKGLQ